MKLYYTKGTCSFGPHMAMRELGIEPELVPVNLMEKKLSDGSDFRAKNPKGYVPFVEADDGTGISECGVILQYLADRHPEKGLIPAAGTSERYVAQDWLSFIGTELHKNLPALFLPYVPDEYRPVARSRLETRLDFLNDALEGKKYLMGDEFSIVDCYATAILNWTKPAKYDLAAHPNVKAYYELCCARDSVKAANAAEEAAAV
ncbi:MAG: glutathione transferase GstA [Alphaproteobacteria bacterium]|jgi:glutathione S-transferase|nr:glutathione transferase GstA [Alphaproteobacteria bacterium]